MIACIAINTPLYKTFDYLVPKEMDYKILKPGMRVLVSFAHRTVVGILLKIQKETDIPKNRLKPLLAPLDTEPTITADILKLCEWAANYYHYPLGEVLFHAIPVALRQHKKTKTREKKIKETIQENIKTKILLNESQCAAVKTIKNSLNQFQCFLLNGVTGSGKTEVYLEVIESVLKQNQQALVLVPEIALTPQTLQRFYNRFQVSIVSLHSGLNNTERLQAWQKAKSGEAKIIIGTRSAIFTPCENLGVMIIDEEHDASFKQQESFRYSARDLAITRAHMKKIPIILGSATPSLEALHNAANKRFETLTLPERAGNAIHPHYHIIDIRNEYLENGLSKILLQKIKEHLDKNNQVLIFLNRRGFAPVLMCHACGFIATCKRCDAHMTLHQNPNYLRCHHCDKTQSIYKACPECQSDSLKPIGTGTERLEEALKKYFPDVAVVRIDRDSTRRKNSFKKILANIQTGEKQILVGTQMLAKGHDFPQVTLVGIINMDAGFFSADFRAIERTAQLLVQVSGRAGRAEKSGEVYIQTHHPLHPMLLCLIQQGYMRFAELVLKERAENGLPPYSYFALIRAEALKKDLPVKFLQQIKKTCEKSMNEKIAMLGPIPSPMPKRKGHFRTQLLFQSRYRPILQKLLMELTQEIKENSLAKKVKWSLDVDPIEMY